jgi:hypothetical protein
MKFAASTWTRHRPCLDVFGRELAVLLGGRKKTVTGRPEDEHDFRVGHAFARLVDYLAADFRVAAPRRDLRFLERITGVAPTLCRRRTSDR